MRLAVIRETETTRDLDVVRTFAHRPELFGAPFSQALQEVMRGESEWSVGERELFATYVSAQNQCPF